MQRAARLYRQTWCVEIWSHLHILREREREGARWFTHAINDIMSQRNFSNDFISYLMKMYELYKIIIISPAPDRALDIRQCHCMSCQFYRFLEICFFKDCRSNIPKRLSADSWGVNLHWSYGSVRLRLSCHRFGSIRYHGELMHCILIFQFYFTILYINTSSQIWTEPLFYLLKENTLLECIKHQAKLMVLFHC